MEDKGKVLAPRSQITSTEDIRAWLQQTGYKVSSGNHWEVLGMAKLSTPPPEPNLILTRGRFAKALTSIATYSGWKEEEIAKAVSVEEKIEQAVTKCLEDLKSAPMAKCTPGFFNVLPFGELGKDALDILSDMMPPGSLIATQYSDILDTPGYPGLNSM